MEAPGSAAATGEASDDVQPAPVDSPDEASALEGDADAHGAAGAVDVEPLSDEAGEEPSDDDLADEANAPAQCFGALDSAVPPSPPPFSDLSDEEIVRLLEEDPAALGSMSLGRTNSGALLGGVQMPEGEKWLLVNARESWGAQETVESIAAAIAKVHEQFPESHPVRIGDLSVANGGDLSPHLSHQAGRDADIGWYYKDGPLEWPTQANGRNIDLARSWAFLRAFFTESDVQLIFVDRSLQLLLYDHALAIGEDKRWLDAVFQYPARTCPGIIRHAPGHLNHFHVRVYAPKAQELGRRAYRHLLAQGRIKPPISYARHKVRPGQTLGKLAARYRTTVKAIQRANGLSSTLIRAGREYRIPRRGGVEHVATPAFVPPRRLPPAPAPMHVERSGPRS